MIVGLLVLGPAQMQSPTHDAREMVHVRATQAPDVLLYDRSGKPLRGSNNASISGNWAGYKLSSGPYTQVSAIWTVPAVTFVDYSSAPSAEHTSTFVGIGDGNSDLIQIGTAQAVARDGSTAYYAWIELLPGVQQAIQNCQDVHTGQTVACLVEPGDSITAQVNCDTNCAPNNPNTTWTLSIGNLTRDWSWDTFPVYTSSLATAEWIHEASNVNGSTSALPNHGPVSFATTFVNMVPANLLLSTSGEILEDPAGGTATPCEALHNGQGGASSFLVAYGVHCPSLVDTHDFNDDPYSDILWRDNSGDVAMWLMNGASVAKSAGVGNAATSWSIVGQRDFNGDGHADLFWRDSSGNVAIWFMNGTIVSSSAGVGNAPPNWSIVGTGDFDGTGMGSILWHDTGGNVAIWTMNGSAVARSCGVGNAPTNWSIVGTGDFDGDGDTDILWRDSSGNVAVWLMAGCTVRQSFGVGNAPMAWSIVGTGDFNGDGKNDILWHDTSGNVAMWLMNGATVSQSSGVGNASPSIWSIAQTGDYNGDGKSDILWHDTSGNVAVWEMNGPAIVQSAGIGNASASVWSIQSAGAD